MPGHSQISFHYVDVTLSFTKREQAKEFLLKLFKREGRKIGHVNYIFCNDDYLLDLNRQYLNHHTLTDIITFELSAPGQPVVSDIYISTERVKENAVIYKTPFYRELHRVIFHGALHLCGYKDKTKSDALRMRAAEDKYLNLYFS
jgi:rRNA maturation RNase YbeY